MTKTTVKTPKRVRHRIMRQFDQGYVDPPHCRASKQTTISTMKSAVPPRSSWYALRFHDSVDSVTLLGDWKKKKMTTNVTAPNGRLM